MTNKNVLENMLTKTKKPVNTSGKSVVENVLDPKHLMRTIPIKNPKHKGTTVADKLIENSSAPFKEIKSIVSKENDAVETPAKSQLKRNIISGLFKRTKKPEISKIPMPVDTTSPCESIKEVKTGFFRNLISPIKKEKLLADEQLSSLSSSDELESEKKKITQELDSLTKDIESMIKDMESKIPTPSKTPSSVKKPAVKKTQKAKTKKTKSSKKPAKTKKTPAKKQASKKTPKKTTKTTKKTKSSKKPIKTKKKTK